MSGCENCHQLGRWHVEGREKMRDCVCPLLTSRLSEHQKNILNLVYHGTTSCVTASLEVDCEQSLIFLLKHSTSRAQVRGEWQIPLICIALLFRSLCMALRKEGRLLAAYLGRSVRHKWYCLCGWRSNKSSPLVTWTNFFSISFLRNKITWWKLYE